RGLGNHRAARRRAQLGDKHQHEAHAHDRRLCAPGLRLQLLRPGGGQPRRVRGGAQDEQGELVRQARRRRGECRGRHCRSGRGNQGGGKMKVRAQIAMVLNLDKCIGCHTCSITCKNVWTNREGMEYVWFNHVETKPGSGYPKDWENQERWKGGWVRRKNGKIVPRQGAKWRILSKLFANPH